MATRKKVEDELRKAPRNMRRLFIATSVHWDTLNAIVRDLEAEGKAKTEDGVITLL